MASSVGSDVFALLAFLMISIAVLLLLRHYLPLRTTPAFLLVPIYLALVLPVSAILLVPIDLASSAHEQEHGDKGIWLPARAVLVSWRIVYWLTFMLTWVVLPLLAEYMDAGYRDPKARMIYSLRSNGKYQLIVISCGVVGLIYMIFSYGFDFTAIRGLVMALAYVWGLMLAIYLMGHGLVAIPRKMFRKADIAGSLRRVQAQAPKVHEKLEEAIVALDELEAQVMQLKQRKTGTARDFQEWIDELVDMTGQPESRIFANLTTIDASAKVPAVITERYLADLTRRLVRARHRRARYIHEWDSIVQTASDLQTIMDSKASRKLDFGRSSSRLNFMTPFMRYHLHVHIIPALHIVLGGILSLASVAVIWSEIIKFPAPQLSVVSLTVIHHPSNKNYLIGLGGQLLASMWITYMCVCALSSVNDVPTWNQRALVKRNTYAESACWYAGQIAKLTVPLAYNFLTFLPEDVQKASTFYQFLGRLINLTPLGTWFDYLFPIFVLIPVCAALFNLYGRIKNVFGFDILEDDEEAENPSGYGTGGWREGRDLIARDLQGNRTTTLGLSDSPRPSLDTARPSGAPTRWVPPAQRSAAIGGATSSRPTARAALDPEPDEENFFTLFGRRVKNTIDTIDTPKWMQPSSRSGSGFKVPKWMGGSASGNADNDSAPSSNQSGQSNNVLGLFGSRNADGRIML
ncbi:LMBR1-like membrane protein-domain-containing protein [Exophiala viscosa]|uniref:LMBR1-like membrane protein-domain-containing protein n=1 Tax=Exophiala viscosa TaxID=2486360 RepID=A0AAN6DR48_9EURO|nr:LMBR1-like membrane protein-domain-containing protein [Exophiala viscosa]KAI1628674.1 LMBR1-like membrane protein-domain-containing protein [Exophiala viscosa]